jgi:hypothetical protein
MNNKTYRSTAKDDTNFFPQEAGKKLPVQEESNLQLQFLFLLHAVDSFVPTFLILVRTCWQEGLLDGAPTGCKSLVNTMEKLRGHHFFSSCSALLKKFIGL